MYKGVRLKLIREPNNLHDSNAIGVLFIGRKCGYISKDLSSKLAPLIDNGLELEVIVTEITGRADLSIGVKIVIQNISETGSEENNEPDWITEDEKLENDTLKQDEEYTRQMKHVNNKETVINKESDESQDEQWTDEDWANYLGVDVKDVDKAFEDQMC